MMNEDTGELRRLLRDSEDQTRAAETGLRREKGRRLKTAIWAAIGGFLLFAVGGHWFPGYQLDSTAEETARTVSDDAVSGVMAELCVERFMSTTGLESRLTALHEVNGDWRQADFIRDGEWAVKPGEERSDHATSEQCRKLIAERVSAQS